MIISQKVSLRIKLAQALYRQNSVSYKLYFLSHTYKVCTWRVQSIQTNIGKRFCKSITIDNLNLNVTDFIDQSIEIVTHNHCCCFKVAILSVIAFIKDLVCNAGVFLEHKH